MRNLKTLFSFLFYAELYRSPSLLQPLSLPSLQDWNPLDLLYMLLSISILILVYVAYKGYTYTQKGFALYNKIIKNSSDLIFTINHKGKIIFYNQSFLKKTGYGAHEIRRMNIAKMIVSFDQIIQHIFESDGQTEQLEDFEFIFTDKSKKEFLFQANITMAAQRKGKKTYTFIARDITEKKKILNDLIDSEERFKAISENTSDAVFLLSKLNILYTNPFVSQILGYSKNELLGKNFEDFIVPEYKAVFLDRYTRRLKGEKKHNIFRLFLLPKQGSAKQVELSINTFQYKQKNAEVIIARDITEQNLLEQQLIQAEKLASLGQLITGISHELNNKLQPIFIYCQLLKMNKFNEKVESQLEGIESSANSAKIILESLLKFGRPGQMMKEKSSINDVVRETLTLIDYRLTPQNISLKLNLDDNIPLSYFDKNQISQVILNILNNAIYAIEKNAGDELSIRTYSDKNMIILTIADSGPGIPPGHMERIFDPFFSTKPVGKGTGLGLSISYSIIKAHNGRIYAANRREGGTIFTIELPILSPQKTT
ncbi:MAG: PAS domain S-box protein [Candidatus Aureabacteria bacterium]|nr:PAS domain S-box protein [Candidatus Auribacterota bacterium]